MLGVTQCGDNRTPIPASLTSPLCCPSADGFGPAGSAALITPVGVNPSSVVADASAGVGGRRWVVGHRGVVGGRWHVGCDAVSDVGAAAHRDPSPGAGTYVGVGDPRGVDGENCA